MPSPDDANTAALVPQGKHVGQRAIPILRPATIIGARHRSHVHLLSRSVSKAHAAIIKTDHGYYIRDLASRTHTFVNGRAVREADLTDGDLIKVGNFVFKFQDTEPTGSRTRGMAAERGQFAVDGAPAPIAVVERTMLIGRREECDVSLLEQSVSTVHALLFDLDGRWFMRDMSSRTGTIVNGTKIHQEEVHFGDEIVIGETTMRLAAATDGAVVPDTEIDELEDLIGTAPLLDQDEEFAEPPKAFVKPLPAATLPKGDDDSIPLHMEEDEGSLLTWDEHAPTAEAPPGLPPVESQTASAAEDEIEASIPLELAADDEELPKSATPTAEPTMPVGGGIPAPMGVMQAESRTADDSKTDAIDLEQEIDLSTDPDVSGPADTTALKLTPDETHQKPAISDRVVDSSDTMSEGQRLLVDAELHRNLSSSATSADLQDAAAEAIASANIAAHEFDELDLGDLGKVDPSDAPPAGQEVELEPRKGWRWRDPNASTITSAVAAQGSEVSSDDAEPEVAAPEMEVADVVEEERPLELESSDIAATFPSDIVVPPDVDVEDDNEAPIEVESSEDAVVEDDLPSLSSLSPIKSAEVPAPDDEIAADTSPEPVAELSGLDFSSLVLPTPDEVPSGGPIADGDVPVEPHVVSEAEVDLGFVPASERAGPLDPTEVIQPLIGRDALESVPSSTERPKPKRPRRATKKADKAEPVAKAAPVAKPEPSPVKPTKLERPAKPSKSTKVEPPVVASVPPPPTKAAKTPRRKVTRKPPMPVVVDPEPVESMEPPVLNEPEARDAEPVEESFDTIAETPIEQQGSAEVLDVTEPTPESALDLAELSATASSDDLTTSESLTDTSFGRQLNDFSGDASEPIVEEPPMTIADDVQTPASDYVADVSHSTDFVEAEPDVEAERPKNALEQIAASFSASTLDDEDEIATPTPSMGMIEADEAAAPNVRPAISETPSNSTASTAPSEPTVDDELGEWPMPDVSDMLVSDDEPLDVSDAGRDQVSFIGGLPLPIADAPVEEPVLPDLDLSELPSDEALTESPSTEGSLHGLDLPDLDLSDEEDHGAPREEPVLRDEVAPPPPTPQPHVEPAKAPVSRSVQAVTPASIGSPGAIAPDRSTAEASPAAPTMKTPPRPKQMGRRPGPTPFAKTPFDAVPDDMPSVSQGNGVPPFASGREPATFGRVTTAFDGLAMPPVRETDVFSHQVPGHALGGNGNGGSRTGRAASSGSAGSGKPAAADGSTLGLIPETIDYASPAKPAKVARPVTPGFRPPAANPDARPAAPRRKRFGLKWLLPIMLLCMVGTAAGIYSFVPNVSPMEGFVDYANLTNVSPPLRAEIQNQQKRLVSDEKIRRQATDILANRHGGLAPGFIAPTAEGAIEFNKTVSADFPAPGGRLIVRRQSNDLGNDGHRLEALLVAIETANKPMFDDAARFKAAAQKAKDKLDAVDREILNKTAEYKATKDIGEARPTSEQAEQIAAESKAISARLATASATAASLRTELEKLQAVSNPDAAHGQTIATKQAALAEAQAAVDAAQKAATDNAEAKITLDGAVAAARQATDKQLQLREEIDRMKVDRKKVEDEYAAAQKTADSAVTVVPFVSRQVNITTQYTGDPRLLYVTISTIGIWVIFICLVALHRKATREPEPAFVEPMAEADAEGELTPSETPAEEPRPTMPV